MPLVRQVGHGHRRGAEAARPAAQGHRQGAAGRRHQQDPAGPPLRRREAGRQGAGAVRPGRSDDLRGPGGRHRRRPSCRARPAWTTTPTASSWSIRSAPTRSTSSRQVYLDPIIKRGADIPCSFTKTYYPVADPAERVAHQRLRGGRLRQPGEPGERQAGRDSLGVQAAAAAARRRPGSDLRVRRRRHPDGADPRPARRPEEALRHPAERARTRWTPRSSSR